MFGVFDCFLCLGPLVAFDFLKEMFRVEGLPFFNFFPLEWRALLTPDPVIF